MEGDLEYSTAFFDDFYSCGHPFRGRQVHNHQRLESRTDKGLCISINYNISKQNAKHATTLRSPDQLQVRKSPPSTTIKAE
jgi:F0F1-type ATP synthase gamma subunit